LVPKGTGEVTVAGEKVIDQSDPVYQVNLLTNSGFGVWSNSEDLYDAGTGAAPVVTGDDAALVAGGSLVTNGGFDSVTTGWTAGLSTTLDVADVGSGFEKGLSITNASAAYGYAYQQITGLTIGKLYEVSLKHKIGTTTAQTLRLGSTAGTLDYYVTPQYTDVGLTTSSFVWEAVATTVFITLINNSSTNGQISYWDSVTLNEVTPGIVSGSAGPDGWSKDSTTDVFREHDGANTKDGSFYALKSVPSAQYDFFKWPKTDAIAEHYMKYRGRTVTLGAWVKSSTESDFKLYIYDGIDQSESSFHTGGGDYEWLEVTHTVNAANTRFYVYPSHVNASPGTAYISQPMLVFGSSIGEGNYVAPVGEWVNCEANNGIVIVNGTALAATDDETLNLEALSSGKIPKGAISVDLEVGIIDTNVASGDGVVLYPISNTSGPGLHLYPTVASMLTWAHGVVPCGPDGDIYQFVTEAGATISNFYLRANRIQVS
jgi:hypothetical protein